MTWVELWNKAHDWVELMIGVQLMIKYFTFIYMTVSSLRTEALFLSTSMPKTVSNKQQEQQ